MADVAQRLGVHKSTVARALGGHPGIPESTRRKVARMAMELGYERDPHLSAMAAARWRGRRGVGGAKLAVVSERREGEGGGRRMRVEGSWAEVGRDLGYALERHALPVGEDPRRLAERMKAVGVDGVLLLQVHSVEMARAWDDFPVVRLRTGGLRSTAYDEVGPNRTEGVREAWRRGLEAGYRRPGLVVFAEDSEMDEAYRSGAFLHLQQEIPPDDRVPILAVDPGTDYTLWLRPGGSSQRIRVWWEEHRPDLILAETPVVHYMVQEAGLSVPGSVALVSLNNADRAAGIAGLMDEPDSWVLPALRLLDHHVRHRLRGPRSTPIKMLINQRWSGGISFPKAPAGGVRGSP